MKNIIIQPILFQMAADLSSSLEMHLSKEFDASVKTAPPINETLPLNCLIKIEDNGNQAIYYNGFWIGLNQTEVQKY
jgi:hypothetical protein